MASARTVDIPTPDGAVSAVLALVEFTGHRYCLQNVVPSPGGQYTFSVWARAEAGMQVILDVLGDSFMAEVSTEWTKIVRTVDNAADVSIDIYPMDDTQIYLYQGTLHKGQFDTDWKPAPEDIDQTISDTYSEINKTISEQNASIINTCESIILSALESYVETSDYDEFKETVEAELLVMADSISANFTETTAKIETVDENLQSKLNEIQKHIEFSIDGIRISSSEGEMSIRIDNDIIVFEKNGVQFGWWDGNDFHTGNIRIDVTERAQFGNYAFVPRSDGSLSFLKVENKSGLYAILAGGVMSVYGAYPTLDGTTLVISDSAGSLDGTTLIIGGE